MDLVKSMTPTNDVELPSRLRCDADRVCMCMRFISLNGDVYRFRFIEKRTIQRIQVLFSHNYLTLLAAPHVSGQDL